MGQVTQAGTTVKANTGALTINFPTAFTAPPVVSVSPFWQTSQASVGGIETISSVTATNFTVVSINGGANYSVNWIAVGEGANTMAQGL